MKSNLLLLIFLSTTPALKAQKLMKVPDSFSTQPVNVNWRLHYKQMQYSFGPYHLVDYKKGKSSWHFSNSGLSLFPRETYEQATDRASFTFTDSVTDTAFVDLGIITTLDYHDARNALFFKGEKDYQSGMQVFTAAIRFVNDTSKWLLVLSRTEVEGIVTIEKQLEGQLTNGAVTYTLKPQDRFFDDKKPLSGNIGYLFEHDNQTVAAVQYAGLPLKVLKQSYMWLPDALEPKVKLVIATSATAIMLHKHMMNNAPISESGPPR